MTLFTDALPIVGPLVVLGLLWLYTIVHRQFRLGERTIDEVTAFLRKIDWDEAFELFNLLQERKAWVFHGGPLLRRGTRIGILKAREYMWRMFYNLGVLHEWAKAELQDHLNGLGNGSAEREAMLREIVEMSVVFRTFAFFRLIRLTIWTIFRADKWPMVYFPSIASLRKAGRKGQIDLIDLYRKLGEAAADAALVYGQQFHDEIQAAL
jgi:hypothetical protein